ncbi:MAG: Hsp33 family molecular chaperone HslO [Lachnospiraceae bacterium]|nr:Hsp33 family molecular chaperone HslO [Lachnospiraceae bacterium]
MSDTIVRAYAADGFVRAFAASVKDIVSFAKEAHGTSPVCTAALGRLLAAGSMMGSMMKGHADVLTLLVRCDGPIGGLCVTADAQGNVKGYVNEPLVMLPAKPNHHFDVGGALGNGILSVIRDLGLKEPYVGEVELQTGEIAEDLTYYFASSEQTPSVVGLGVLMNKDNTVAQAGGFIIQLMPDCPDEIITSLEQNIKGIPSVTEMLADGMTPQDILNRTLEGLNPEVTDTLSPKYVCNCSKERYEKGLMSLGKKDLDSLIQGEEDIEVVCRFCGKKYTFSADDLRQMRDADA